VTRWVEVKAGGKARIGPSKINFYNQNSPEENALNVLPDTLITAIRGEIQGVLSASITAMGFGGGHRSETACLKTV